MYEIDKNIKRQSDRVLWVIQILFGLVLSRGFILYRRVILNPFSQSHLLAAIGLLLVFITIVLSWIDFSQTMDLSPYILSSRVEKFRFVTDVFIIICYAYMLFSVDFMIIKNTQGQITKVDISQFVFSFSLVYFCYIISGFFRRVTYGYRASRIYTIIFFMFIFISYYVCYKKLLNWLEDTKILNYSTVIVLGITVVIYRVARRKLRENQKRKKKNGLTIGVDIDGTLANQIVELLPIINKKYNLQLNYNNITGWRLKIANTDIAKIIEENQEIPDYLLKMPMHRNAKNVLNSLSKENKIVIITSRQAKTDKLTKKWLFKNKIAYDNYINTQDSSKSNFGLTVLIDDFIENIEIFLRETSGYAILVKQPWNSKGIDELVATYNDRLFVIKDWKEVKQILKRIKTAVYKA